MTALYAICLAGLFCSVVLIWKVRYLIDNDYAAPFAHFNDAATGNCITNPVWHNVLT